MTASVTSERYRLALPVKAAFMAWWHALSDEAARGQLKADRAILRRCENLTDVTLSAAFQRVYWTLHAANTGPAWAPWQQERIAALVALSAHVRGAGALSLPRAMHQTVGGSDRAGVSELRFKRLLESPDIDSLFTGLRRVMPLIDHQVDVGSMAQDVFGWGDGVRKRWAYAYYDPTSTPTETSPARAAASA